MQVIYNIFVLFTVIFLCPCTRTMVVVLIEFVYTTESVRTVLLAFLHTKSVVLSSGDGVLQQSAVYTDKDESSF